MKWFLRIVQIASIMMLIGVDGTNSWGDVLWVSIFGAIVLLAAFIEGDHYGPRKVEK